MFAKDYRELARENLRGNWKLSVGTAMLACLLGGLVVGSFFWPELKSTVEHYTYTNQDLLTYIVTHPVEFIKTIKISSVLNLVHLILGGATQLGYASFLLKQHDHKAHQVNDLFSKFEYNFGSGFCLHFLKNLYILLWSLLLVIPGIVAAYRYSMAPFIMAEHPEMTATEVLRASKQMMNGNKWELFCLHMSFFGWMVLCALTLNIGWIWLNPYMNAAYAAFYRRVSVSDPYSEEC